MKIERFSVGMPWKLWMEAKREVKRENLLSMNDLINRAVTDFIRRNEANRSPELLEPEVGGS